MTDKLDWDAHDEGMAHTWMGGEPETPATVFKVDEDGEYNGETVACISGDLPVEEQNYYAKLFANAPRLLMEVLRTIESLRHNFNLNALQQVELISLKAEIEQFLKTKEE